MPDNSSCLQFPRHFMLEKRIPKSEIGRYIERVLRRILPFTAAAVALLWAIGPPPPSPPTGSAPAVSPVAAAQTVSSVRQFASYINDLSEPDGYFYTDNFISNETSYLHVVDDIRKQSPAGGVYL